MEYENIFEEWGTTVYTTYQELIECNYNEIRKFLLNRNLLVIKGIGPGLSDECFYNLGKVFGKVWEKEDYRDPFVVGGRDSTNPYEDTIYPVSYFKSNNNMFGSGKMDYHADMPHIGEKSYPGRALYMVNNTTDSSGSTSWLNMELSWELFSDDEKKQFEDYEIVLHDMYESGSRIEKVPFLKVNPMTGKKSPTLNCIFVEGKFSGWIRDVLLNGNSIGPRGVFSLHNKIYSIMENKKNTLYKHNWNNGDILIYDNWFNVHKRESVNDESVPGGRLLKRLTFNFI